MHDFVYGFLMRSEVMFPAVIIVAFAFRFWKRGFGATRSTEPFNVLDIRTWPLWFVFVDSLLFVAVFAAVTAALGEGAYTYALGGGVAALLTFGVAPFILPKIRK